MGLVLISVICGKMGIEFNNLTSMELADGLYIVIIGLLCLTIALCLTVLVVLHTYLAANALTSWEFFSWKKISYMKACVLKRPRHEYIIKKLLELKVTINYITEGDIAGCLSVISDKPQNDIYYSTGGGPEGD